MSIIDSFADAIAYAEGFYVTGSRARRNHNPGNLKVDIINKGIGSDSNGFIIYPDDSLGFEALKKQISKMFDNTSSIYNSAMSIIDVARKYTPSGEQDIQNWANNVASRLGVSVDTTLNNLKSVVNDNATTLLAFVLFLVLWKINKE